MVLVDALMRHDVVFFWNTTYLQLASSTSISDFLRFPEYLFTSLREMA